MPEMLPLFLTLTGRRVVLVGGGRVAAAKLRQLLAVGANVRVVSPEISADLDEAPRSFQGGNRGAESPAPQIERRGFLPSDLDDAWLVVAAATPEVNREVAEAAEARRLFVNAVDDPANATAFLSGVVRRAGVTIAISTQGEAPALTALLREALDAVLPRDLDRWIETARRRRIVWKRDAVPMDERKPQLLDALNDLYTPKIPWLNSPEDSWL
jgi:siroheme synthase-like protein